MPKCSFGRNKAEEAKAKNVIIGEARLKNVNDKILAREVTLEKTPDGKESLKITVKASRSGGQESSSQDTRRPAAQVRSVRLVASTGQTGQAHRRPRTFKPKHPEVGTWKVNESKVQGKLEKQKLTFDQLLNKYTKVVPKDRPLKKNQVHLRIKASVFLLGENPASVGVIALQCSLLRRCILLHRGRHRHRVFLILHGYMKEFGCIVIRCYTHNLTIGRRITEGLCSAMLHDQCMTD